MKKLLETLLSYVATKPEEIKVTETENGRSIIMEVSAAKEDMGRIIGKDGKIIQALRNLLKIRAIKEGKHVEVVLIEPKA